MNAIAKSRKYFLVAALVVFCWFGGSNNVQAGGPDPVLVTNTSLPVNAAQSGAWSVGLTGTPAVSAAQSGPWNVGISGNPGVTIANSSSQPVPITMAGPITHMGQPPQNHIVLSGSDNCQFWTAISLTGIQQVFSIPPGNALVITDVDMSSTGGTPGLGSPFFLVLGNFPVFEAMVVGDSNGASGTQQHLTGGIVTAVLPTCETNSVQIQNVFLRGYLVATQ